MSSTQERASALAAAGRYSESVHEASRALRRLGRDPTPAAVLARARLCCLLGRSLETLCQHREAARAYARALREVRALPASTAEVRRCLAEALADAGRLARLQDDFETAESLLGQADDVAKTLPAPDRVRATTLNEIGVLCKYTERFSEADAAYREALSILVSVHGEDSPALASLYHNLGGLEHARGRPSEGEAFARKSVALRSGALGEEHPVVAQDQAALAAILDECGQRQEAEALYRAALRTFENAFGPVHYEIAVNLGNLATLLAERGAWNEAEEAYRGAIHIEESILGPHATGVALSANNLAALLARTGKAHEAEIWYARALSTFESALGPTHSHTIGCREDLATLRARLTG